MMIPKLLGINSDLPLYYLDLDIFPQENTKVISDPTFIRNNLPHANFILVVRDFDYENNEENEILYDISEKEDGIHISVCRYEYENTEELFGYSMVLKNDNLLRMPSVFMSFNIKKLKKGDPNCSQNISHRGMEINNLTNEPFVNYFQKLGIAQIHVFLKLFTDKEYVSGNKSVTYLSPDKKTYITRDVTYIGSKSFLKVENVPPKYRSIVFTHSFVVRGCWVKTKPGTIGKNRLGERIEKGRTWRIEHKKKKDLEPLNKLRIIKK